MLIFDLLDAARAFDHAGLIEAETRQKDYEEARDKVIAALCVSTRQEQ